MDPIESIWREQCEAARNTQRHFGSKGAMAYLVGEKFIEFLKLSKKEDAYKDAIGPFAKEVMSIFPHEDLQNYFEGIEKDMSLLQEKLSVGQQDGLFEINEESIACVREAKAHLCSRQ